MSSIPRINAEDIRKWVDAQSFERGRRYYQEGAVFEARQRGMALIALCEGSQTEPYRVEVTFSPKGITDARCSCPVGGGGRCKHVAAGLLAWMHSAEDFLELEDIDLALELRSKDELIALVKQMVRREPNLESLLEMLPPERGRRRSPVDPETYRRQAAAAFRIPGYQRGVEAEIADRLRPMLETGDGFAQQHDHISAAAVYQAVVEVVLERYGSVHDEEDDLAGVADDCASGLGRCLRGVKNDTAVRGSILRALFAIYRYDIDSGGIGLGDGVPGLMLELATPDERRMVAGWVRESIPKERDEHGSWTRQAYGGFWLDLEQDVLDDEGFLRVCREVGRVENLVDRLLALGRLEEAAGEARLAGDYDLISLANIFVRHKRGGTAELLMRQRSENTKDSRVLEWLRDYYKGRKDNTSTLEMAEKLFRMRPSLEGYKETRQLAQKLGRWEALGPALVSFLKGGPYTDTLIRVHLLEGEIDLALEAVREMQERGHWRPYGFSEHDPRLEVAKAAEETRPRPAMEIYRQYAEGLIAQRSRPYYQEACKLLKRVRSQHERLGELDVWTSYAAKLRDSNRKLRALKEEMADAGL